MSGWGTLKRRVPKSVCFQIGDLPMYTFLVLTYSYLLQHSKHYLDHPNCNSTVQGQVSEMTINVPRFL